VLGQRVIPVVDDVLGRYGDARALLRDTVGWPVVRPAAGIPGPVGAS
jgi:hypothetical protein